MSGGYNKNCIDYYIRYYECSKVLYPTKKSSYKTYKLFHIFNTPGSQKK